MVCGYEITIARLLVDRENEYFLSLLVYSDVCVRELYNWSPLFVRKLTRDSLHITWR